MGSAHLKRPYTNFLSERKFLFFERLSNCNQLHLMKFSAFWVAIFLCTGAFAQSKKELTTEISRLKAEIDQLKKPKEADLTGTPKKVGYSLGVIVGDNIKLSGGDSLDIEAIQLGIRDAIKNQAKIKKEEAGPIVQEYMRAAGERKRAGMKKENTAFLEANKSKEGVVTTASGLQYKILKTGTGKLAKATDQVSVNYKGTTIDGVEFDSSEKHGGPSTFTVNKNIIAGWTEALQLMHEGDKWILYIPSELGWGEQGAGEQIPPFAVTIFEVELVKIL